MNEMLGKNDLMITPEFVIIVIGAIMYFKSIKSPAK